METRTKLLMELARLRGIAQATVDNLSLQYLRLPDDYYQEPPLKFVEDLCLLASESQSFYRSISCKQWLRTVVLEDREMDDPIIHSNVVPRQAYLDAACHGSHHCRGFTVASEITSPRSCKNCALAKQMLTDIDLIMDVDQSNTLLQMEDQVKDVQDLAQGKVYKILWRRGTFVRKRFDCQGLFDRELEVVTRVSHPNIVHCFGFSCPELYFDSKDDFEDDSCHIDMFMEYLDADLQRFLDEAGEDSGSPFSFRDSLDVLLQVAEAMKHLHERNFVHGDLKPQNIFMSCFQLAHSGVPYYLAKVGDFGCAQRVDISGATVEPFIASIGTTGYIAPEVLRCRPRHGGAPPPKHPQKIDVYSFGVVAYQVLTGVTHLYVDHTKASTIAEGVLRQGFRPNSGFNGTLDDDCSSLLTYIETCWAENPEERPSFTQICDELKMRRSNYKHGVSGGIYGKRKNHVSIGEGASFVKSMKTGVLGFCKQALSDRNGMMAEDT